MDRAIVLGVAVLLALGAVRTARADDAAATDHFSHLPPGWAVAQAVPSFNGKIGDRSVQVSNVILRTAEQRRLQINTVTCKSEADAAKVQDALIKIRGGVRTFCPRESNLVFEFVGEMKTVERAYLEFGFKPQRVVYEMTFQAAPIARCDYMQWNKLYNAFLAQSSSDELISTLAAGFTFGQQISLRAAGLGSKASSFKFEPPPASSNSEIHGEITTFSFKDLPLKFGIPQIRVTATVVSEAFGITPSQRTADAELLGPTEFWPSTDEEINSLASEITGRCKTREEKLAALLAWFSDAKNFKFDRRVVGSRYGVKTALNQRYGMCWDYSDCFITLCRASGGALPPGLRLALSGRGPHLGGSAARCKRLASSRPTSRRRLRQPLRTPHRQRNRRDAAGLHLAG